jgi:hypothetical protein
MKKSKKLKKKLASRIKDWEETVARSRLDAKAYRKPGSNK